MKPRNQVEVGRSQIDTDPSILNHTIRVYGSHSPTCRYQAKAYTTRMPEMLQRYVVRIDLIMIGIYELFLVVFPYSPPCCLRNSNALLYGGAVGG